MSGLVEWAVREIGAHRILFGTDTPLYSAPMQRARIDYAEINDDDKRVILWENAAKLLNLKERQLDGDAITESMSTNRDSSL